jgi:para-nitrobenzyl esterase
MPTAAAQPPWAPYARHRSFLHLGAQAHAGTQLLPGRFELHEEVIARRRAAGNQNWYINVGLAAPVVPSTVHAIEPCRSSP